MAAERKKVPGAEIEPSQSSPRGSASGAPVGPDREGVMDRLAGLDVRAQSALLHEAFQTPDSIELETPGAKASPQSRSIFSRYGWRGVKSALGLLIVVICGSGTDAALARALEH